MPLRRPEPLPRSALDRTLSGWVSRLTERRYAQRLARRADVVAAHVVRFAAEDDAAQQRELSALSLHLRSAARAPDEVERALAHAVLAAQRTLGLHARCGQCQAALALLDGRFVEMPTGEGKTLTIALGAAVVALTGTPVHVLTANDYLAERDASWLAPLYEALGVSYGCVQATMAESARRTAYACDIVHLTGKQVAFDWLRDGTARPEGFNTLEARLGELTRPCTDAREQPAGQALLRGLCFAIVDEADSLLFDEARTPLVLATQRDESNAQAAEPVIALALARQLHEGVDFELSSVRRRVDITEQGLSTLRSLAERVPGTWRASRYRDERVRQALTALHLLHTERDYIVRDGQVELVDEQSGRTLPDRRLQHGLHRLVECKEGCALTQESEVIASVPFQRFLRGYVGLVGTSGTLQEVRSELSRAYEATLVRIAPAQASRRRHLPTRVVARRAEQLDALVDEIRRVLRAGRAVLVGTRSVEQSSGVSATLDAHGLAHRVLNARQDREEARIVAAAGEAGQITVATNMAGRGTDIPLDDRVVQHGGLHVISLGFNDARRIDRQLAGRVARQGQPGSCRRIVSLNDTDLAAALPSAVLCGAATLLMFSRNAGPMERVAPLVQRALAALVLLGQRRIERRHALERRLAREAGDQLARHVAIGGGSEPGS